MKDRAEHHYIETNGVTLHVVAAGPEDGPLVLLLHGFPDFWYGWRHQIPALAAAGYRVLAPDQRGYNLSEKPVGAAAYGIETLAADIVGLIHAVGRDRAFVVGHDWGGGVAWELGCSHPECVERLAILNSPYPAVLLDSIRRSPAQLRKSWYILFFQIPALPEFLLSLGNWRLASRSLSQSSRPGAFTDLDMRRYRRAWSRPRAMTSMLNWYRAAIRHQPAPPADPRVHLPTMLIWGAQDQFLGRDLAVQSLSYCDDIRLEVIDDATHWVQHEEPERVNRLLLDFLRSPAPLVDE
ncbi:MAG: alpha/beta fold hydrolase [Chloroflexia bacterium]